MLLFRFGLCSSYFSCKSKWKENKFAAVKQCTIFVLFFSFLSFFFLCEKYRENRLGCPLPVVTVALINLRKTPFLGRFPDSVSFDLRRYLCDGNDSTKAHSLRNWVSCLVNETFHFISVSQLPYLIFTFKPLTIRNQQFLSYILRPFEGCFSALQLLLNQYVSHGFNVLVAIISPGYSFIATRIRVIVVPSSAKLDPGVSASTIIFVVSNDTNPRLSEDGIYR